MAQIQTNNDVSSKITLSQSTRQGCCLSPLLFTLAVEPLVVAVKLHPSIKGKKMGGATHKISLYADVLIYLMEPGPSIPALLETLTAYSVISGYKIYLNESVVMPLNMAETNILRHNMPFQWSQEKLTYIGLQIPNAYSKTFSLNYLPLLKKTEAGLNRWMNLH